MSGLVQYSPSATPSSAAAAVKRGVAEFLAFLAQPEIAAEWHQQTGYLPITKAAYEKTKASGFYEKNPVVQTPLLELTNKEPTENSRGLRFGNMVQIRDMISEEIEAALAFGTGQHATTAGCLEALDGLERQGERFVNIADIGTGTGLVVEALLRRTRHTERVGLRITSAG